MRRPINVFVVITATLSACASAPPTPSNRSGGPTATSAPVAVSPAVTVLRRVDQPSGSAPLIDLESEGAAAGTPDYREVLAGLPKVGALAPDFTLRTIDGQTITLGTLRGRPVLINFWASWCVACRAEAPELEKLYEEYKAKGLVILGVNVTTQDTVKDAQGYVSEFKLTFPIPIDGNGDATKAYGVPGLPTSFFVDAKGVIRNLIVGQMDRASMLEGLDLIKTW